ncbi:maleylpyruvate isomerase family mycothiol-dependent enzyme [Luteipulveratus flavus]|uniref:Maleylpyruvate isomerase family mycothiol-dependent enzyme n=1 Tax=Luteipulveratus flavus TaxID=3031728 RepID=A0ABT6C1W8_9MICO|nr:maleylpyruvate isomerase family mycothiol-dependent enzyme [Luteipulveratus sp. YIM 133296]MDF8262777.1 maleylpyruvate isomerase family mycothiol-dependent enzyme [Luteipulveratus sp. YIM 133296]
MAMHPPAPTQLPELVEAWKQTTQAVIDLATTASDAELARETTCPGWTVKDHIAHVAGLETRLDGHVDPDVEVPDYPWLRHDTGRFMERAVEVRRSWTGAEVVAELTRVIARRAETLQDPELTDDTPLPGPTGPRPALSLLTLRTMDIWCHEQDIRDAMGRPGDLDSPAAALFVMKVLEAFPEGALADADLPVGTAVIVESTGPVLAREGMRVVEGEDGTPVAEPLFSGTVDGLDHSAEHVTTIRMTTEGLARAGAGRYPVDELRYSVEGDEEVARRVLEALVIVP